MKVSVSLITYNHAPYIRRAIESVLAQETDFDFELLIGEDDSNDGTREIVKEYAARHPDKIRLFLHERKNVLHINGRPTSKRNWVNNVSNARGQYVALLDGDDYWVSPRKLQTQADFLDRQPECSACFHATRVIYENETASRPLGLKLPKTRFTLADILAAGFHIPTCSYFFRNHLISGFPDWFFAIPMSDLPIHVLMAQHGLLGWLEEEMAVYLVHSGGFSSGGIKETDWLPEQRRRRTSLLTTYYETVDQALEGRYHDIVRDKLSMLNYDLVWTYQQDGNLAMMRRYLREAARFSVRNSQTPFRFVLKAYLIAYGMFFDSIYRHYRGTEAPAKT